MIGRRTLTMLAMLLVAIGTLSATDVRLRPVVSIYVDGEGAPITQPQGANPLT